MPPSVVGIVLAGGASTRFGADKCFADWRGRPFVACVARALAARADALVVLSRHGEPPQRYAALVPGARVVPDAVPGEGPVAALRRALDLVDAPFAVVAACDAPGLTGELVGSLVNAARAVDGVAVLEADGRLVHAVFAGRVLALRARLAGASRLGDVTRGAARVAASGLGLNVNAPDEAL